MAIMQHFLDTSPTGFLLNPHANRIIITICFLMLFTLTSITVIILIFLKGYYPFKIFPHLFVTMLNLDTLPSWWFL